MPANDQFNETAVAIVTTIIIFLAITGMVIFILLFYQKKRYQHQQTIIDMQKSFSEELFKSQIEIQEQTFGHISQEIHDNVGQILSLAKVQINIMNESERMDRNMLNEVKHNIGKAMSDLRDIAKSLSSERIKAMSINSAIEQEAERINKSGIIRVQIKSHGNETKMDEQKKLILFRMIQESLQNIIKHAEATEVNINFTYGDGSLNTTINDNGKGFDIEEANQRNQGLGLNNLRTRATLAGGTSTIESKFLAGTIINITMPYA